MLLLAFYRVPLVPKASRSWSLPVVSKSEPESNRLVISQSFILGNDPAQLLRLRRRLRVPAVMVPTTPGKRTFTPSCWVAITHLQGNVGCVFLRDMFSSGTPKNLDGFSLDGCFCGWFSYCGWLRESRFHHQTQKPKGMINGSQRKYSKIQTMVATMVSS